MKSIKNNVNNMIIINKSKFICYLYKINSIEDVDNYLVEIKNKYKDATHHCYAYILDNTKRFNDDKEPGGTAGMPILNVLEANKLNGILCIVVRYFGGIKLGAGGLVRAYTKSVTEALNTTEIYELKPGYLVTIEFDYDDIKKVDKLLENSNIIDKEFNDKIIYKVEISEEDFINIQNLNIKSKKNILI